MRKLLLSLLLLLPLTSCANSLPEPASPQPVSCKVPILIPLPPVEVAECGENICLTVDGAVAVSRYLADVKEVESALARCPYVERVP